MLLKNINKNRKAYYAFRQAELPTAQQRLRACARRLSRARPQPRPGPGFHLPAWVEIGPVTASCWMQSDEPPRILPDQNPWPAALS